LQEDFKNLKGTNDATLSSVKYNYQQASGVDVKVASRYAKNIHTEGVVYSPETLTFLDFVFSDATLAIANVVDATVQDLEPPIMSEKYWNVETKRTGKLLPYLYEVPTMTIPADPGNVISTRDKQDILDEPAMKHTTTLVVESRGTGYLTGDIVGIKELNILLRVTSTGGQVTSVVVLDNGENLPLSFCMPSKNGSTSSTIRTLLPNFKVTTLVSSAGKGFEAYFVCSQVRMKTKCDPKPFIIKQNGSNEIVRIAANKAGPTHDTSTTTAIAEGASYVSETAEVEFKLDDPSVKSKDSTYDIFFHFHNDITMTWLACGHNSAGQPHGDKNNATESTEQHITIESINLI
jgi:hypothetical protein